MAEEEPEAPVQPQTQSEPAAAGPSVIDELIVGTGVKPGDDSYGNVKEGLEYFMRQLIDRRADRPRVKSAVVNEMIAEIDKKLSGQVDEILHHAQLQKLESAWRGLKLLVDKTNFRENVKIELLNVSKEDLLNDFEDSPEVVQSGLYKKTYIDNYGVFGGEPVGAIVANYEFDAGSQDMSLLQSCASVSAMAHAPFLAAVGPNFFGVKDYTALDKLKDVKSVLEGPKYTKWNSFRESEDARYVGLAMPRYLARLPYGKETIPVKAFDYEETVTDDHANYLWSNASYAFASRVTDSFAKYRFCTNIIGPKGGGAVEDLPIHNFEAMGAIQSKIPTETLIPERREFELAEEGFMALTMRKGSDNACFFSANSCQKPKFFGNSKEGKESEANYRLGLQLPYLFIVNRLAHYLKVLQREEIGSTKTRPQIEQELNKWISQYVLNQDIAPAGSFARRPLRAAEITVEDVAGEPGWYKIGMKVKPHFKLMGMWVDLSLVGKLDK